MSSAWNMPSWVRGVIFLLLGVLFLYFDAWSPIDKAMHNEPQLRLAGKAIVVAPLFLGLGVLFLIFGEDFTRFVGINSRPSKLAMPILLFLVALGLLLYFWVQHVVAGYGYTRQTTRLPIRDSKADSPLRDDGSAHQRIVRYAEWKDNHPSNPAVANADRSRVNSQTAAVSVARMASPSGGSELGQSPESDRYVIVLHREINRDHSALRVV
jgi:hypothetical protein